MTALLAVSANAQDFVKVEEAPADWCGEYLIVYEADDENNIANVFNGSLTELDGKNNFIKLSNAKKTVDGKEVRVIEGTSEANDVSFTVTKSKNDGMYYIQSKSGYWIGYNSTDPDPESGEIEPNLKSSNEKQYDNSIAMESGKTNIVVTSKNGFELRFNNDSGKERFRYHASGKKKAIKFYKKVDNGVVDAISNVSAVQTNDVIRDITGRQVQNTLPGHIYIQNNKKVIVK